MRRLPPSPLINTILYEEITSAGDVEPLWPSLPPGCSAEYELVQAPAGSSATASLSGLLEDADLPGAYILQRNSRRMGQVTARDFAVVHWPEPASGSSPGWDEVIDIDLTGLTVATLASGSGSASSSVVTRAVDGATVCSLWTHIITNTGTITTGASGVAIQGAGASGSASALVDVATEAGITLPDDGFAGLAVSVYCTGAVLGSSSNSLRAGMSGTQERFSQGTSNTVRLLATSSGAHTRQVSAGESHTTWATSQTNPTGAWVVTVLAIGGEVCWAWYGSTPPSDADLDDPRNSGAVRCSGTITADVSDAIDSVRYTAAHAGVMASLAAGTTMTRIRARTRRLA